MAEMMGAKEVAQELGTTARELRKFLRDFLPKEDQPGQGGRYAFSKADVKKLAKGFKAMGQKTAAKKDTEAPTPPAAETKTKQSNSTSTKKGKGKTAPAAPPVEDEDIIELEDLDGPSDEELEGDEDKDSED